MNKKKKKEYAEPKVTKISLDAKCAVLGFCKISGGEGGPNTGDCGDPFPPCVGIGS